MRIAAYIGGLLGLALLITLVVRSDASAMLGTLASGGPRLLWLVPYRTLFFSLCAIGWLALLRPIDSGHRAGFAYVFWVTTVREAVDRLLPVASIGGSVVGVRLLRWRRLPAASIAATVIVETVLTLIVIYLFTAVGLFLLAGLGAGPEYRRLVLGFLLGLPVPVMTVLLLHYGSAFGLLRRFLRPLAGVGTMSHRAAALDHELRACMRRGWRLLMAGSLQLAALGSGCFEIWFALRLFGHPVDWLTALMLESTTQAVRHLAFVVPAGLGVQEAGLVMFGHTLGIGSDLALAVSMAKRLREVLCGVPALLSWQWLEGRRLHVVAGDAAS